MPNPRPGRLVVISGPSGAGKSTLLKRVLNTCPRPLTLSVSATTRRPRPGEIEGVDYHFLSLDEFTRRREAGQFLECCQVYASGDWYGTPASEVAPSLAAGKWVVLEIDVQGTLAVLEQFPDALTIFVQPASTDELEKRLRARGTEDEAARNRRLEQARAELAAAHRYQHQVINDDLDRAVDDICKILTSTGD